MIDSENDDGIIFDGVFMSSDDARDQQLRDKIRQIVDLRRNMMLHNLATSNLGQQPNAADLREIEARCQALWQTLYDRYKERA